MNAFDLVLHTYIGNVNPMGVGNRAEWLGGPFVFCEHTVYLGVKSLVTMRQPHVALGWLNIVQKVRVGEYLPLWHDVFGEYFEMECLYAIDVNYQGSMFSPHYPETWRTCLAVRSDAAISGNNIWAIADMLLDEQYRHIWDIPVTATEAYYV